MGCVVWVWLRQGLDKGWVQCEGWDWMRFTSRPATTTLLCVVALIDPKFSGLRRLREPWSRLRQGRPLRQHLLLQLLRWQ